MDPTENLYWYKCSLDYVIDGDSARLFIDVGFKMFHQKLDDGEPEGINCRLLNADAPETYEDRGDEATEALEDWLEPAEDIVIRSEKIGKYGRPLVTMWVNHPDHDDWVNVNRKMLELNFVDEYDG